MLPLPGVDVKREVRFRDSPGKEVKTDGKSKSRPVPAKDGAAAEGIEGFHHSYAHRFSIFGGFCRVCITTQYCSVFACNALNCSFVAPGARTSKMTRMLSKPT